MNTKWIEIEDPKINHTVTVIWFLTKKPKIYVGNQESLSKVLIGKLLIYKWKTKTTEKLSGTLEPLQENIWKICNDTGMGNHFLKKTPISQEIKARIDQQNCTKLKSFWISMKTVTRIMRQHIEWHKSLQLFIG
jgi:hypothetical protein